MVRNSCQKKFKTWQFLLFSIWGNHTSSYNTNSRLVGTLLFWKFTRCSILPRFSLCVRIRQTLWQNQAELSGSLEFPKTKPYLTPDNLLFDRIVVYLSGWIYQPILFAILPNSNLFVVFFNFTQIQCKLHFINLKTKEITFMLLDLNICTFSKTQVLPNFKLNFKKIKKI